jgi:hypothetical protein
MSEEQSKSLMEQRMQLERQLRHLQDHRDLLYMPGVTLISGEAPPPSEQIELQIEELQAAIAQIDEAIKSAGV